VINELRYEGYIARQRTQIKRQAKAERMALPAWLNYASVAGLRGEAADVLGRFRPATMGQASRLAGVNPADLTLLAVTIRRGSSASAQPAAG
jgi:tRNA uridine 5-carboxymethylaminomethyl modification enzyme